MEVERLTTIAPAVSATVARHFQQARAPELDPGRRLANLLADSPPFDALTGRAREVCRRILLGFSSQAISTELGISLHSTLIYRKRAYEKLGISSQNELFGMVLGLVTLSGGRN